MRQERKETAKIMKILVTGVKGQLGHDVVNELTGRGHQAIGVDIEEMDITDPGSVEQAVSQAKPDGVIHCAAWTAVDDAEDEKKREKYVEWFGYSASVMGRGRSTWQTPAKGTAAS